MPRALLAVVVAAALCLTAVLVLGLLGGEDEGGGGGALPVAARETEDPGAHLHGTGTATDLVPAREADLRIAGRVLGGDGKALAGCRVGLHRPAQARRDPRDPSTWSLPTTRGWGVGPAADDARIDRPLEHAFRATQETTTDADGHFEIAVDARGRYLLRALVEPPRAGSTASVWLSNQRETARVSLRVVDGAPLEGRVLDAADEPVAAVVEGTVGGEGRSRWTADPVAAAPADGRFGWPALPPGQGTFQLTIPGRLVLRGLEVALPHDGLWTIRLDEAGGAVAGRILDGDGAAVPDARILVDTGDSLARATSAADGAYRAEGLVPGRIQRVIVEAEGFGLHVETPPLAPWAGAEVQAGQATSIDVTLDAGATVTGVVREVGSGKPLAGAEVFVLRRAGDRRPHPVPNTKTDAAGRYVLRGVPPGLHVVIARSATHHLPALEVPQPTSFAVTPTGRPILPGPPPELLLLVSEGDETLTKDLELMRGLTLEGRVEGPDGQAVAGAAVRTNQGALSQAAWRWGVQWPGWGAPLATTDEAGRFRVEGLSPNDAFPVRASKGPLTSGPAVAVRLARDEPPEGLVLRLAPSVVVEGRLLGPDGEGVEGWINAWSTAGGSGSYAYQATEADGSFRLEGLPAGGVRVSASSEGIGSADVTLEPIAAGEVRAGVEIRLRAGVRVSGILVDQHGNPLPDRTLSLARPQGGAAVQVRTDADGRFEVENAPKGRLQASVYEQQQNTQVPVQIGQPFDSPVDGLRLTVTVPERTVVEGAVVAADGIPVPICRVTISPVVSGRVVRERSHSLQWTDADEVVNGAFRREVKGEPPFEIAVTAPRGRDGRPLNLRPATLRVVDPAAGPVEVRLEPGEELAGRVTGPDGEGVAHVTVQVGGLLGTTDADGRFRLGGLAGGPAHVELAPPPGWVKPNGRTVPAGDALEVVLVPATVVAGTVQDADGKPITEYVRVETSWQATGDAPAGRTYGSATNGSFRVDGIPRGAKVRLVVTVYGQGGSTAPVTLDVAAGDEDVAVVVGGGPVLAGVVLDEDGEPLPSASLTVLREGEAGRTASWIQTTEEGRFRVSGVEPGRYHVTVRRPGETQTAAEVVTVTAPSENVRIRLVTARSIRGRLVGGKPGRTYSVRAQATGIPGAEIGRRGHTGEDGSFEVQGLGAGHVVLFVRGKDGYALSEPLEPGSTGVELRLQEGARIAGTVVDGAGKPPARSWLTARSDRWEAQLSTQDGAFEFRGLPPGRYRLVATGPSTRETGPEVEAATGSTNVQLRAP